MDALNGLLNKLREVAAALPDRRTGKNKRFSMIDLVLGAFSVFFMQSPSFLAHQRLLEQGQGASNCQSLLGMAEIPGDDQIRRTLDGVNPDDLADVFRQTIDRMRAADDLAEFRRLGGHVLIALDGTEYFTSRKVQCSRCSHRKRSDGETEYFHQFIGATIVSPGHTRVLPLPPEFITPQDGHEKQDCEQMAGKRWLDKHGRTYADLKPIYLGDDLYAKQPMCEHIHAAGGHFILTCKPSSHPTIAEYVHGATFHEHQEAHGHGKAQRTHTYRWLSKIPMRDSKDAMEVDWLEVRITNAAGKTTYFNTFITDLTITRENVVEIGACGRTRWKVENETFNVLKNNGYHLEHSFGHGKHTLASVLVILNLIAFAFHTACAYIATAWKEAALRAKTRYYFFEQLRSLTAMLVMPSWEMLMRCISPPKGTSPVADLLRTT